jgi:hypothetical protein
VTLGATRACVVAAATLLACGAARGSAQAAHAAAPVAGADSIARFLQAARTATERYHDRHAAVADGYAQVGPDFPGMGEHWINLVMVFARGFDARHPAVLEYATVGGRPVLVGVAYALPLLANEMAPDFPSVDSWHGHLGTVDEEAQLLGQLAEGHGAATGARLAMLHAWVWLENPAGLWVADNWALPFVRAGLPPPADAGATAGRAMSLVSGGDRYFTALIEAKVRASSADSTVIRESVSTAARAVRDIFDAHLAGPVAADELSALRTIWRAMWASMERGVSADARGRLAILAQGLSG